MNKTLPETIHCISPQLVVSDMDRSIHFYTEQLGFRTNFRYESYAGVGLGIAGTGIHLKLGTPSGEEQKGERDDGDVDIVFGVTDLDSLYETVTAKDIEIVQPLRSMSYGREFLVRDPDGYRLAFFDVTS